MIKLINTKYGKIIIGKMYRVEMVPVSRSVGTPMPHFLVVAEGKFRKYECGTIVVILGQGGLMYAPKDWSSWRALFPDGVIGDFSVAADRLFEVTQ